MTLRFVQLARGSEQRVAIVDESRLCLLFGVESVYALVQRALSSGESVAAIAQRTTAEWVDYDAVYDGRSEWRVRVPIDHPEPARCLVSGTGLTHLGSAANRHAMHNIKESDLTDSMRMFRLGLEGGRPAAGQIGVSPEWFYKGNGTLLRAHSEPLDVPPHAGDGGEEGEIAGIYIVGPDGHPLRIGMCIGNEFSDHVIEKKNYLYLAGSKLRTCSLGPELVIDPSFSTVPGRVAIEREGTTVWSKDIATGETEMCHSLANMEHHHFKYDLHRRPGDVHVHYFGAYGISFGDGVKLADGDVMEISFEGFGRALRNPLRVDAAPDTFVPVRALGALKL
jgi:hypothetical protein